MIPSFFNAFCTPGYFFSYLPPVAIELNVQCPGSRTEAPVCLGHSAI
ncbi:hypothetical protein C4K37_4686 [Pseudomonas chlororaphis subsp. piscium]|nr:hypothetical protein C4K37_4686 [Pseudomonas chlororaphis subsp. piscium]AZC45609.1 hypothetical protein C4K36_4698 [Pseudomonas chlororaphis subsp. piscium]